MSTETIEPPTEKKTIGYICFFDIGSKQNPEAAAKKEFEKYQEILSPNSIDGPGLYWDVHPGTDFDREQWKKLKDRLQEGDEILVTNLQSFSKTAFRVTLQEIDNLQKRGITFRVASLEDRNLEKQTFWNYVVAFSEYFEQIRVDRQRSAIASIGANFALRRQKYPGRKTVLDAVFLTKVQELLKQNITSPTELARQLQRSRSTIYKALKLLEEQG